MVWRRKPDLANAKGDRQSVDEGYSDAIGIVENDLLETDEEKVDAAYVNDLIAQI